MNLVKMELQKPNAEKKNPDVWRRSPLLVGRLAEGNSMVTTRMLEYREDLEKIKARMIRAGDMDYPTRQHFLASIVKAMEDGTAKFSAKAACIQHGLGLLAFAWIHRDLQDENGKEPRASVPDDVIYMTAGYTKLLYHNYAELRPEILLGVRRALAQFPGFYMEGIGRKDREDKHPGSVLDRKLPDDCLYLFADRHDSNVLQYMLRHEPGPEDVEKFTGRGAEIVYMMMGYASEEMKAELGFRIKGPNGEADAELAVWSREDLPRVIERLGLSTRKPFE